MSFLWLFTLLGTCVSALIMFGTFVGAKGAPQEAAGYAMACAFAVVPYVFTRAVQGMTGMSRGAATNRIVKALEELKKPAPETGE